MILVAGSLHLDVMLAAPHLPAVDETVTGQSVAYAFGGKGGNQAVAAARMGAEVAMAGRVGSDGFAATLLAGLAAGGVDATQVQRDPGASGMSVAITLPGGEYGAVIVSAANLGIDADAVVLPDGLRWLMLQNEIPAPVNLALARRARAMGAQVCLNAAPARALAPDLAGLVDLLVVNRVEAEALAPAAGVADQAAHLAALGPARVVVTRGAAGVVFYDGQTCARPAPAVDALSSHGAGDMFTGALVADLARGAAFGPAVDFAQAAAALHVATPVAARAAITPAQVRAFQSR